MTTVTKDKCMIQDNADLYEEIRYELEETIYGQHVVINERRLVKNGQEFGHTMESALQAAKSLRSTGHHPLIKRVGERTFRDPAIGNNGQRTRLDASFPHP